MKLLIIGANSYVGARLYFDLSKEYDTVGTFFSNKLLDNFIHLDITKKEEVEKVINEIRPNIIIHVANNASAKWCEEHPEEAIKINQTSTQYIVDAANDVKAKVVYISSFAAIDPTDIYGRTKLASEEIVKQTQAGYLNIRPSLIIGFSPNTTNDRPFNRLLKNIDQSTPAVYDTSWKFQPTYIGHLSEIIDNLISKNIWNQTVPVAVEILKSRYDIAKDILSPFGIKVEAVDKHDTSVTLKADLSKLDELYLPQYSYEEVVEKIIGEIRNREHRISHI